MPIDIFAPAIAEMKKKQREIFGPISFQQYLRDNNLPRRGTAASISIDTYQKLPSILKEHETMVLRLGVYEDSSERETQFVLIKKAIRDFFLYADVTSPVSTYLPKVSVRDLFAYQVLPAFSENSLVNLALASGLLSHALNLDREGSILNPATGKSIFSFDLKLHSSEPKVFNHNEGQVDIDSLFIGRRNAAEVLFLLEAKLNSQSLSKHKLVYPILAIAPKVPADIEVVPVYMTIDSSSSDFHFHIYECTLPDPRKEVIAIDQLEILSSSSLSLPRLFIG